MADNTSSRTFRKHSITYVGVIVGTLFWLAIPLAVAITQSGTARLVAVGLCLLILAGRTYRFFYRRTIRWVVRNDGVRVSRGILPWRKSSFLYAYETIFEAYYTHTFLGHWLNYGTVAIRRTEGITSTMADRRIRDAKTLTTLINSNLKNLRTVMKPVTAAASEPGVVERLTELARLKASGDINADEYEVMKARTIGEPPPDDARPSLAT
jgi:hypothetical protein